MPLREDCEDSSEARASAISSATLNSQFLGTFQSVFMWHSWLGQSEQSLCAPPPFQWNVHHSPYISLFYLTALY